MTSQAILAAAVSAVLLAMSCAAAAAPVYRDSPRALKNSPVPLRGAVFKPSTGLYQGRGLAGPYWPHNAWDFGAQGYAIVDCTVLDDLRLQDCRIVSEEPHEYGFGEAVQRMAGAGWMTAAPLPPGAPVPPDHRWRFGVPFQRPHR
jgi:hypothetical protein